MKKKIALVLAALLLMSFSVHAQEMQQGMQEVMDEMMEQNMTPSAQAVESIGQARARIQIMQEEMQEEMMQAKGPRKEVLQNQNEVRMAVHSLLAMENLTGGIGPQVRQIARNFNNSVQATIRAEENIKERGAFMRFFAGGDEGAAEEIKEQVSENRQRVEELRQLRETCLGCPEEVRQIMQEQIQDIEQEQERLSRLVQREKNSKGIFGWIWK